MQTERRVAANPHTKPTDLGSESAERLAATIRRHHHHLLLLLERITGRILFLENYLTYYGIRYIILYTIIPLSGE